MFSLSSEGSSPLIEEPFQTQNWTRLHLRTFKKNWKSFLYLPFSRLLSQSESTFLFCFGSDLESLPSEDTVKMQFPLKIIACQTII